jgi:hypothetical protein
MDHREHATRNLLATVGGIILSTAVIAWTLHWGNAKIHQDLETKRNQNNVWWLENWRTYAKPELDKEFNELKRLLKENK